MEEHKYLLESDCIYLQLWHHFEKDVSWMFVFELNLCDIKKQVYLTFCGLMVAKYSSRFMLPTTDWHFNSLPYHKSKGKTKQSFHNCVLFFGSMQRFTLYLMSGGICNINIV